MKGFARSLRSPGGAPIFHSRTGISRQSIAKLPRLCDINTFSESYPLTTTNFTSSPSKWTAALANPIQHAQNAATIASLLAPVIWHRDPDSYNVGRLDARRSGEVSMKRKSRNLGALLFAFVASLT